MDNCRSPWCYITSINPHIVNSCASHKPVCIYLWVILVKKWLVIQDIMGKADKQSNIKRNF